MPELHVSELATLKENLVRAKKLLANSPRDLREERAAEVQRLELAVRRMESVVQRERRQKVERVALEKIQHEEKEKRKQGKGAWHIKKGKSQPWLDSCSDPEAAVSSRSEGNSAQGEVR